MPELISLLADLEDAFGTWNDLTHDEWRAMLRRLSDARAQLAKQADDEQWLRKELDVARELLTAEQLMVLIPYRKPLRRDDPTWMEKLAKDLASFKD